MKKIWKRIEAWLEQNAPEILSTLQPGASAADIKQAERALSCKFPKALAESYRIHDGKRSGGALFDEYELLSLDYMVSEWKVLKELLDDGTFDDTGSMKNVVASQIKFAWWNPLWIPIASNSSGDFWCVDLDPSPSGKIGQIISFVHTDPARELIAKDFETWLAAFADDLEDGKYKVADKRLTKTK